MTARGENEYVLAMHDFVPAAGNSTCLAFRAGQVIHVLNKDTTGWWDGELEGRRGWFPSNYVKADKKLRHKASPSSESGSDAESCPRVMVSLYHALLVLNTSVHASRISHYQPSTACVISSVRTVLTATDCLHKTAPALSRFPHLARARSDVLQELGRLVAISKKASAPGVPDEERAWLAEDMLRFGDAVFASCKRYVEVAVSCGIYVAERRPQPQIVTSNNPPPPRLTSASVTSLSSISSSTSPPSPAPTFPTGTVPASQLLSALRTTHDHLLSIIAAFIGHVHSHSRASHASSKGHLIEMTRETVDKVRQVLTIVGAVCDHRAVIGPERATLSTAKDTLYGATSALVEAVKRMLAPVGTMGGLGREDEEKAVAVQAATGTLRAGGDCVTAVRSCLTRHTSAGYNGAIAFADGYPLVFEVPAAPPSVSDHTRSISSASGSEASVPASRPMFTNRFGGAVQASWPDGHPDVGSRWPNGSVTNSGHARRPSEEEQTPEEDSSDEEPSRRTSESRESMEQPSLGFVVDYSPDEQNKRWDQFHEHDRIEHALIDESQPDFLGKARSHDDPRLSQDELHLADQTTPQPDQIRQTQLTDDVSLMAQLPAGERDSTATEVAIRPVEHRSPSVRSIEQELTVSSEEDPVVRQDVDEDAAGAESGTSPTDDSRRDASIDASSSQGRSSGAPSALFEPPRTSDETGRMSIGESISQIVFRVEGVAERDPSMSGNDGADGESLMIEPSPTLAGSSTSGGEDNDSIAPADPRRTPVPPQTLYASDSAIDFQDDASSLGEKASPTGPGPIPISPSVDWLAAQTIDPRDIAHNKDGKLIGATLDVLVEKITPPDRLPDPHLFATFFLTFRLFMTPLELVQVLHHRWDLQPPPGSSFTQEEYDTWSTKKLEPVRLRVYNFIKAWLDSHWHPNVDMAALGRLEEFVKATATDMQPAIVQRVVELLAQRESGTNETQDDTPTLVAPARPAMMDRVRSADKVRSKPNAPPTPVVSKSLFASLRAGTFASVSVVDFDALELARQFTIMESKLFNKILPEDVLDVGLPSSAGERGDGIRAMSTLSTAITGWVTETILDEQDIKKRTGLLKFFIKIADQCHELNNFSTLRSILAGLDSSAISRLSRTWIGLSAKNKARIENLRKLTDHTRNHNEYRTRLKSVRGHAVPFLGLYLTDVTFCREGNPDKRVSPYDSSRTLLNFDKYRRLAAIAEDVKRFQAPYNLIEISEVQKYLEFAFERVKKNGNELHDLYDLSLSREPRQPADNETKTGMMKSSELFNWGRDKS